MAINVDGVWSADAAYSGTLLSGAFDIFRGATSAQRMRNLRRYNTGTYADDKTLIDDIMVL